MGVFSALGYFLLMAGGVFLFSRYFFKEDSHAGRRAISVAAACCFILSFAFIVIGLVI